MHEMAIAQNILGIIQEEMQKNNLTRLTLVKIRHGSLNAIVPEALQLSFEALIQETPLHGARLEAEEIPLLVRCQACTQEFSPEGGSLLYMPCPFCGEEFGHEIIAGKEIYIDHLEAE